MQNNRPKVVVIGGGTGSFALLDGLKTQPLNITAIVNMADDGGSTGVLRDELGVLPPGDVRQCLVALSRSPKMRDLFDYRFESGTFEGHSFGNIFLTVLEKTTGNFASAVETASDVLRINGKVVPATLDNVRLKMTWGEESVELHGEHAIDETHFQYDPRKAELSLVPKATPNPRALEAIRQADVVVIAPGDLYSSLGPLLIIDGVGEALKQTNGKIVYVCNLVTKRGQTDGFTVADHAAEIERFVGGACIDTVLYNTEQPDEALAERYQEGDAYIVETGNLEGEHYQTIAGNYLGAPAEANSVEAAPIKRSLIRHDSTKIVKALMEVVKEINRG